MRHEGFFMGAESIALDPNDDQRVFMSTGQYTWGGPGRLYVSGDRGDRWQHVELPFPVGSNQGGRAIGERMVVDPNLPSTLFYGSRTAGLWKSVDTGQTWSRVQALSPVTMTSDQIAASEGSAKGVELVVFDTSTRGTGTATLAIYVAVAPDYAAAAGIPHARAPGPRTANTPHPACSGGVAPSREPGIPPAAARAKALAPPHDQA